MPSPYTPKAIGPGHFAIRSRGRIAASPRKLLSIAGQRAAPGFVGLPTGAHSSLDGLFSRTLLLRSLRDETVFDGDRPGTGHTSGLAADDETFWNAGLSAASPITSSTTTTSTTPPRVQALHGLPLQPALRWSRRVPQFGDFEEDLDPPNPGGEAQRKSTDSASQSVFFGPWATRTRRVRQAVYYFFDQEVIVETSSSAATHLLASCSAPGPVSRSVTSSPFGPRPTGSTSTTATSGR